jgi:O-methyltransferase involved in polyketide biosynthesis
MPYLTRQAISDTLDFIAGIPRSEVVFDYAEPFENYAADRRAHIVALAESAAAQGEPWLSLFDPAELSELLCGKGFGVIEDLGLAELSDRYYGALKAGIPIGPGGMLYGRNARSRRTVCSKTSNPSSHTARAVRPPW